MPLGSLLQRSDGEQGCALKALDYADHLWEGHSFSQSLAAKIMMSTDNSNYGLISNANGNGQIEIELKD